MPEWQLLPRAVQWAIEIGVGLGATGFTFGVAAFVCLYFWKRYAGALSGNAEKSIKEIIDVVGPKPDTPESEQEADNPTTLVGVVKKIERSVQDFGTTLKAHIVNDDTWQKKTTREIASVKREVGLGPTKGRRSR